MIPKPVDLAATASNALSERNFMRDVFVHVPNPGDHYSPRTGSAIISIIYELARAHAAVGGATKVLVSRGSTTGYPPYSTGELVEVEGAMALPDARRKALDVLAGGLVHHRPFMSRAYRGAIDYVCAHPESITIVHNEPGVITSMRTAAPEAKLCFWVNNDLFRTYGARETRAVVRACDWVVCCSSYIASGILRKIGPASGLEEKVHVVLNGVDAEKFRPVQARPDGPPVILFVGRVVEQKGPDLLVRAARILRTKGLDFRLRVVGSAGFAKSGSLTPYEESLRALAEGLKDVVEFIPFVPREQVPVLLQEAAVFCVPSNWDDPCPLAVLEGLACGLPMVVSSRGGIPEECGDAALYFDPPDVDMLAHHIEALITDSNKRANLGSAARRRAELSTWGERYRQFLTVVLRKEPDKI
jgi:glycosyltransferase involved in cell wall biosynthesis